MTKFSNTQRGATMHFKSIALQESFGDCIPVVVAPADKLLALADVMDTAEAAEEELALGGLVEVTDGVLDPEQAAACGRSTPTLIIN